MNPTMLRILSACVGLPVAVGVLVAAAVPAHAADDGAVVQGTWTIDVKVAEHLPNFETVSGTWTYYFGTGCAVGETCKISGKHGEGEVDDTRLTPSAQGFTWTEHTPLDCFDTITGELSTPHGADYNLVGHLRTTSTEVRDGVTYVTAMSGTVVETIEINAAGLATSCSTDGQGGTKEVQRAVLTGSAVPLPDGPAGASTDPVGIDPDSAGSSGTVPAFTLPLSDDAAESAEAVSDGRRSSVPGALSLPSDAIASVVDRLSTDLLLVALLGLLIIFPAQIFNSTYEENHERIERSFRRLRPRRRTHVAPEPSDATPAPGPPTPMLEASLSEIPELSEPPTPAPSGRARRVGLFLLCALAGTALGGLLDPRFGANRSTAALLVGVFAALLVAVLVAAGAGWLFRAVRHQPHDWYLRAIPGALLVAVLCLVVSRLTHFQPGYLYGVLGGALFVGVLARRTEGRVEAVTLTAGLGLALGAWVAFEPVARAANGADAAFAVLLADSFLACLFIGGIEGMLFSLVPLRFLPGYRIRQWGWVPWAALTLVTTYVFVHVLLVPEAGYLGKSTAASATVTVALFVAFGLASAVFWLWFRLRPDPAEKHRPSGQPTHEDTAVPAGETPVAVPS